MHRLAYIFACTCIAAASTAIAAAPGRAGTRPATRGTATAAATPPPAPEEVASFYQSTVDRYMKGDWAILADDITRNLRLQNALSKEQQADITYIKTAVLDGRPAWWDKIKAGQKQDIAAKLWGATVNATWDPDLKSRLQVTNTQGKRTVTINWNPGDMDSPDHAEHGFTKGELSGTEVWAVLESARLYSPLTYQNISAQTFPAHWDPKLRIPRGQVVAAASIVSPKY